MTVASPGAAPGLYVHVPFCVKRCAYCDFYSVTDRSEADRWLGLLATEARLAGRGFAAFDTVYVGGGTPSCLGPDRLATLLATVRAALPVASGAEVTVELNPDDVDGPLIAALVAAGVTRASVGVQSFDDDALRLLGRRHGARRARDALDLLRRSGPADLALDLIYGWPGQAAAGWCSDLDLALQWSPEHLSCYELTVEPSTPLGRAVAAGALLLPDEEASADRFVEASERLSAAGYEHYEVSNYARGRIHRSRHNGKYWERVPCLGLGPGAHSFDGRRRWWNAADLGVHLDRLEAGEPPAEGEETLDAEQGRLEALLLGLRTADGVPLALAESLEAWPALAGPLQAEGLLRVEAGRVVPTREGLLHADGLARELSCSR